MRGGGRTVSKSNLSTSRLDQCFLFGGGEGGPAARQAAGLKRLPDKCLVRKGYDKDSLARSRHDTRGEILQTSQCGNLTAKFTFSIQVGLTTETNCLFCQFVSNGMLAFPLSSNVTEVRPRTYFTLPTNVSSSYEQKPNRIERSKRSNQCGSTKNISKCRFAHDVTLCTTQTPPMFRGLSNG